MVKSGVDLLAKTAVKILGRMKDGRSTLALKDTDHGGAAADDSGAWRLGMMQGYEDEVLDAWLIRSR
jgi:hypothetical protein